MLQRLLGGDQCDAHSEESGTFIKMWLEAGHAAPRGFRLLVHRVIIVYPTAIYLVSITYADMMTSSLSLTETVTQIT